MMTIDRACTVSVVYRLNRMVCIVHATNRAAPFGCGTGRACPKWFDDARRRVDTSLLCCHTHPLFVFALLSLSAQRGAIISHEDKLPHRPPSTGPLRPSTKSARSKGQLLSESPCVATILRRCYSTCRHVHHAAHPSSLTCFRKSRTMILSGVTSTCQATRAKIGSAQRTYRKGKRPCS